MNALGDQDPGVPRLAPPSTLRARVLAQGVPAPLVFLRASQGFWLEVAPAVKARALFRDSRDRFATRLLSAAPGAQLPDPEIPGHVTWHVIEGIVDGPAARSLTVGDTAGGITGAWIARVPARLIEYVTAVREPMSTLSVVSGEQWVPLNEGVRVRVDPVGLPGQVLVIDARPRAVLEEHVHEGIEELMVLAGSCVVEGEALTVGDYHRAAPDSTHHPTVAGDDGCRLLCVRRTVA